MPANSHTAVGFLEQMKKTLKNAAFHALKKLYYIKKIKILKSIMQLDH